MTPEEFDARKTMNRRMMLGTSDAFQSRVRFAMATWVVLVQRYLSRGFSRACAEACACAVIEARVWWQDPANTPRRVPRRHGRHGRLGDEV